MGVGATAAAGSTDRWPADDWRGPLLLVRLSSLGDVILTTGPLRQLRARRPELTIHVLTRSAYAPALRGLRTYDRLLLAETPPAAAPEPPYATVLDWQGGTRGARAAARYAPGARRVIAPRAALHRRLLVLWGNRLPAPEPYVTRLARSLAGRALPLAALVPECGVDPQARLRVQEQLARHGSPERGWAVLAPGASRALKSIPDPLAEQLERRLQESGWGVIRLRPPPAAPPHPGARPVPSGDPPRWQRRGAQRLEFRGEVGHVAALLSLAGLCLASDSGILHLATALGTPAVGLFGPTVPELGFSPLGRACALGVDLACRPCHIHGPRRCWLGHRRCWRDLEATRVMTAAEGLLSADAGGA